jgi:2-hydroxy-3-keto-5-methylthiopentenyl-1-phosphate phosphatase
MATSIPEFKITIPKISIRDLQPQRLHTTCNELEQIGYLIDVLGSNKRESLKNQLKLKAPDLEESIKRAKKFAMEQSVRFVLVKQQQQQQKQQLDMIKKQQALLLMCRLVV